MPADLVGQIRMTYAQLDQLRVFVETTTLGGSLPFSFPDQSGGNPLLVRFGESLPQWRRQGAGTVLVDIVLEILPGAALEVVEVPPSIISISIHDMTPTVGQTLVSTVVVTGTPTPSLAYQWQQDTADNGVFLDISGATSANYTVVSGNLGNALRLEVTATNSAGVDTGNSAATSVVEAAATAPSITSITISDTTPVVGQVLTASVVATGTPAPTYSYQWKSAGTNVGTNSNTYTVQLTDEGNTLTVEVTATNSAGFDTDTSAATSAVAPAVYYISVTGSDSNDGLSTTTPKQTIAAVNALSLNPGEQVLFKGGDSFSGALVAQASGAAGEPIVWGSYGTGKATILSGSSRGFTAQNRSYLTVQDLIFTGGGNASTTVDGILFESTALGNVQLPGITIQRCDVSQYGRNGIVLYGSYTAGQYSGFNGALIDQCTVDDCTAGSTGYNNGSYDTGTAAILVQSVGGYMLGSTTPAHSSITVSNCTVTDCPGKAGASNWTGTGIFLGQAQNSLVTGCDVSNTGSASSATLGTWMADGKDNVIRSCISHDNHTGGTHDGGGFGIDAGSLRCIIERCLSYNNDGAGYNNYTYSGDAVPPNVDCVVRYNISINDNANTTSLTVGGLRCSSDKTGSTNNVFYGNTIYSSRAAAIGISLNDLTGTSSVKFLNNNIYVNNAGARALVAQGVNIAANATFRNNNYYTPLSTTAVRWASVNYATVAAWLTAITAQERLNGTRLELTADPLFTGSLGSTSAADYQLSASSPLNGRGLNLNTVFGLAAPTDDYFGNDLFTNTGGWTIGFHDRVAGTPDTTPAAFTFTDVPSATVSTVYTSNTIAVAHLSAQAAVSITGGTYSKNGGAYTSTAGIAVNGDSFSVRQTSSSSNSTSVDTVLTIGTVSDTFTTTTEAAGDTTPDAFTFTDQSGVVLSTMTTSAPVTISGIDAVTPISVTGGEYNINGGTFTSTAGTVVNGDQVRARAVSASTPSTAVNVVVTIGGVSDTFTITTGSSANDARTDAIQSQLVTNSGLALNSTQESGWNTFWAAIDAQAGLSAKIKLLYVYGSQDEVMARINVMDPPNKGASKVGAGLVWAQTTGYDSNASSSSISTGLATSDLGQNTGGIGCYLSEAPTSNTNNDVGAASGSLNLRILNTGVMRGNVNSASNVTATGSTVKGFRHVQRISSTQIKFYDDDGLPVSTVASNSIAPTWTTPVRSPFTSQDRGQAAMWALDGALSDADILAFRNALVGILTVYGSN